QLPRDIVEGILIDRSHNLPGRPNHLRAGHPTLVIDGVVAHHFEVLRLVPRWHLGVACLEGVGEARSFNRRLFDAVYEFGSGDAGYFEDGRYNVNDMMELVPQGADFLDMARPRHAHALASAAKVRCDLLGPAKRRAKRPGPAHGHVVVGPVGSPN